MTPVAQHRTATEPEAGRACPYCRFPLKGGVEVVACGSCASVHHADCWGDNHGCAIVGCVAGPSAIPAASPPPPPPPAAAYEAPAPPPATATQVLPPVAAPMPRQPVSRGPWLIAAVVILALAIGGAATAYVVTRKKDKPATAQVSVPVAPSTPDDAVPQTDPGDDVNTEPDTATPPSGVLPDESRAQMKDDIESLLLDWHNDVVNGEYRAAWNLMTPRKREQKAREDGYNEWAKSQASVGMYLDPSGLYVSILDVDDATGVVTVSVHGMRWLAPNRHCTYWSGVTWVKYENGQWLYEPGYSTTEARRAYWEPRKSETLGSNCA
jgi:hypothetical protein